MTNSWGGGVDRSPSSAAEGEINSISKVMKSGIWEGAAAVQKTRKIATA